MPRKVLVLLLVLCLPALPARAVEIKVISASAVKPGLLPAAAAFETQTGHKVAVTLSTGPLIRNRLRAGEKFDVVVVPATIMMQFVQLRRVEDGGVTIGKVGTGVAVRPGAIVPVITTRAAFLKALSRADGLVFGRAAQGLYVESLLKKEKLWPEVEPRVTRYDTPAEVIDHLLRGRGNAIGFGPVTELIEAAPRGLVYVGPLPPDLQKHTAYKAATLAAARQLIPADKFVRFLDGPVARKLFKAAGIE